MKVQYMELIIKYESYEMSVQIFHKFNSRCIIREKVPAKRYNIPSVFQVSYRQNEQAWPLTHLPRAHRCRLEKCCSVVCIVYLISSSKCFVLNNYTCI